MSKKNNINFFGNNKLNFTLDSKKQSFLFQNFESFPRPEVNLVEDDIRLVLDQYKSSFITFEILRDIYALKHLSQIF